MPIEVKVVFIVFAAAVTPLILLLRTTSGPDSHWRVGRRDPIRNLIFRRDGLLRKYAKVGMLLWIWGAVVCIWFFV